MRLRSYQSAAIEAIKNEWLDHTSTMVVMATGLGKTVTFAHLIKDMDLPRVLVVAHREELIMQAQQKIQQITGFRCDIEMADRRAELHCMIDPPRVIISTIQTQTAGGDGRGRMTRFNPDDFDMLIIDENHHAVASTYKRMIAYYSQNPKLKILGVTATPDRADESALGQVFETCAFDYDILSGIEDGWLVPVNQQMVTIEGLDYSHIRTTAGDLNGADLGEVMEAEKNLQGVADATLNIIGGKRTLVFTATVAQAERLAEIFNRHKEASAEFVCGKTDKDKRREILGRFLSGQTQIVTNCAVMTEGYDNPAVEVIIMAKPTKSRSLYAQMAGRSLRPSESIANTLNDWPLPEMRRHQIKTSNKPTALIVDFVGNAGRHKLCSTADILGGKFDDDVVAKAVKKAKEANGPVDMTQLLEEELMQIEEEKQREAARRARLIAKSRYSCQTVDPFDVFKIKQPKTRGWDEHKQLSEKQKAILEKQGIKVDDMTYTQGHALLKEIFKRWDNKLCSYKQAKMLMKRGLNPDVSMEEARAIIDSIAIKEGWAKK